MPKSFFVVLVLSIFITGCISQHNEEVRMQKLADSEIELIEDYGNGLYYIPTNGRVFGKVFSRWLSEHPELKVVEVIPNGTGGHGYDVGYFVLTDEVEHE